MANIRRMAMEDNVLPLAKPIIGVSEKVYDELPVPAGTLTTVSLTGYNMYVRFLGSDTCGDRRAEANSITLKEQGHMGARRL